MLRNHTDVLNRSDTVSPKDALDRGAILGSIIRCRLPCQQPRGAWAKSGLAGYFIHQATASVQITEAWKHLSVQIIPKCLPLDQRVPLKQYSSPGNPAIFIRQAGLRKSPLSKIYLHSVAFEKTIQSTPALCDASLARLDLFTTTSTRYGFHRNSAIAVKQSVMIQPPASALRNDRFRSISNG